MVKIFHWNFHHATKMRMKGLEPSLPKKLEPKSSASTNSATSACSFSILSKRLPKCDRPSQNLQDERMSGFDYHAKK